MAKLLKLRQLLALQTRQGSDVDNEINRESAHSGYALRIKALKQRHPKAIPRTDTASFAYNCHGLTFGARRTQITSSSEVRKILMEDEYQQLDMKDTLPGDIVIYLSTETHEIEHSGIVVEKPVAVLGPLVVSKWGDCHEVIHYYGDCPYVPCQFEFYRIST